MIFPNFSRRYVPMDTSVDVPKLESRDDSTQKMGIFRYYPTWLQKFATPTWFVAAISLFTIVQSMVNSGLFPAVIGSIERQYGFNSVQSGIILSTYDVVSAIFVVIVTNFGHRAHRPVWMSRGMVVLGVGCFIVTIPHWISGNYIPINTEDTSVCGSGIGAFPCRHTQ